VFRRHRRLGLIVALALVITSAAAAAWVISGSGSGEVGTKTAVDLTISEPTPASALYPGATVALTATIDNSNPFPVHVSQLDLGTISSGDAVNCPTTNVTVNSPSYTDDTTAGAGGAGWDIAANDSTSVSLTGAVSMVADAANGCQAVTFTVPLTATAHSNAS
jgi:hypothetical protein